jgi:hypothetical protein
VLPAAQISIISTGGTHNRPSPCVDGDFIEPRTAERLRLDLAGRHGLTEKKVMGGVCFMVSGSMCCGVTGAALMVRVGREAYPQMLA